MLLFYHRGEKDQILDRKNGGGERGSATTKTLEDFLKSICGRLVVVKLNSRVDYRSQSPYFLLVK